MAQIEISVVIPTYKRAALLQKCLQALAKQTLAKPQYEIIVVSDGPDTESEQVVKELLSESSAHLQFLSLTHKKGPAAARNLGWQTASGNLIAFTDDDCLPDSNWLQAILSAYNNQSNTAFTGKVIVPVSKKPTDFELNTKGLETGEFVTANCVLTKAALQLISGFDEAFTQAWREDSDIHFKLLRQGIPIIKLQEAIVVHPVRKAPWGVSLKEQKKTMFNALLYKKHPALYRQRIRSKPALSNYVTVLFLLVLLFAAFFKITWIIIFAVVGWISLTAIFIFKRLVNTRKTPVHIFEMVATSIVIPVLSVYWTLYGAIKYKVLFF
jgi:glycosyltransferase involved in cell wall biosynthesis